MTRNPDQPIAAPTVGTELAPLHQPRDCNLDLLRATAILMVAAYHLVWMAPVLYPRTAMVAEYGRLGVDVFFVLSGWLIGGLYWRELRRFGSVKLRSFLPRRWLRTLPPYFAALLLAWAAAWASRKQPFPPGYLIFIQNYYAVMPFFLVSWSLCVEEHFYIVLPLGLKLFSRIRVSQHWFFAILLITSPVSRWFASRHGLEPDWGYQFTATHLRFEGLALGFWASFLPFMAGRWWLWLRQYSRWLFWGGWLLLAPLPFYSDMLMYRLGYTELAAAITMIMLHLTGRNPGWIARSRAVHWIALTSYSVYLTHTLMIHAALEVITRVPSLPAAVFFPLSLVLIATGGALFYLAFERSSLLLRARFAPRRTN
jgi:peptidoglycan/LPS O-acetylase OafA/YrhL